MARFERMSGLAKGIVIDINDPAGYNRIKVRIPELHGVMNRDEVYHDTRTNTARDMWIDDDKLPWAEVCYPFGDTTPPEINQVVWIVFLNGFVDSPVIVGWAGYEYTSKEDAYRVQTNWYGEE